jgi:tRNA-modifying protein YgfZ
MPDPVKSPLLAWPGAVEASWPDEGVAAHYGDPMREQRMIEESAGIVDRSNRGVLRITGPDRLSWLHSLTTQQLEGLAAGAAAQALVLSPNGHIEHHLTLTDDGTTTWVHVEPGTAPALVEFLESMRFMLRVEVADVSAELAVLTVLGPDAGDLVAGLDGVRASVNPGPFGTIDLIVARDQLPEVAGDLVRRGAAAAGMWAFEALRIAAHVPRLGLDTDHRTIPHEVGWIDSAVHLNKGCYRGQETVARVHNLGHPPRRLVFLHLDGSAERLPGHGDPVELANGEQGATVGFTGSAARHYELGPIALALVKRTVPADATLLAGSGLGVPATQEVIVPPDAGANVKVTLRRRQLM